MDIEQGGGAMEGWLRSTIDDTADTVVDSTTGGSSWLSPTFVVLVAAGAVLVGVSLWWLAKHGTDIHRPYDDAEIDPAVDSDQ